MTQKSHIISQTRHLEVEGRVERSQRDRARMHYVDAESIYPLHRESCVVEGMAEKDKENVRKFSGGTLDESVKNAGLLSFGAAISAGNSLSRRRRRKCRRAILKFL